MIPFSVLDLAPVPEGGTPAEAVAHGFLVEQHALLGLTADEAGALQLDAIVPLIGGGTVSLNFSSSPTCHTPRRCATMDR